MLEIEALVFDLDGTLVCTERRYETLIRAEAAERGIALDASVYAERYVGMTLHAVCEALFGADAAAEIAVKLRARFWADAQHLRPIAGLRMFLRAVDHLPRAVATSADRETARRLLQALRLEHAFAHVVTRDDLDPGRIKPFPDLYQRACRLLDRCPARCVAFEDSAPGIRAALDAGLRVVEVQSGPKQTLNGHWAIRDYHAPLLWRVFAHEMVEHAGR